MLILFDFHTCFAALLLIFLVALGVGGVEDDVAGGRVGTTVVDS